MAMPDLAGQGDGQVVVDMIRVLQQLESDADADDDEDGNGGQGSRKDSDAS